MTACKTLLHNTRRSYQKTGRYRQFLLLCLKDSFCLPFFACEPRRLKPGFARRCRKRKAIATTAQLPDFRDNVR